MREESNYFQKTLMKWQKTVDRPMPWKGEKNPYYIWLSEVILQQTRVEQGWEYFNKFKANYPTVHHLADAPEDEVMKMWEGLGYYSRARNLHFTAKYISKELNGVFPKEHSEILKLKGVGAYTAAAIASFAYNSPYPVIDGNVNRVLSRYFGVTEAIDSKEGKVKLLKIATVCLHKNKADIYNQAIMDFGAIQCKPKLPECKSCPLQKSCYALRKNMTDSLPLKTKKIKKRTRYFNYFVIQNEKHVYLNKRTDKDIWQNLYEFLLLETESSISESEDFYEMKEFQDIFKNVKPKIKLKGVPRKQQLTHQKIIANFWLIDLNDEIYTTLGKDSFVSKSAISKFAFPKIIDLYLDDKSLYLELN